LPPGHRRPRVKHLARVERREEPIDLALIGQLDLLVGVREDESVHAHHHRKGELLGELEGLNMHVDRLLVGLHVQLDPARVAL
jgi:hypothetical protein